MAGCAVIGVVIERFAYRPLRDAPRIAPLISALGVSFFLAYSMQLLFGAQYRDYDLFDVPGNPLFLHGFTIGGVKVSLVRIIIIVSAFALMIALWFLVNRTRTGKATASLVTHNHQRTKAEAAPALHDFRRAIDENHLLAQLVPVFPALR